MKLPAGRRWTALAVSLLVGVRLTLDAARWLGDPARYWNWEEAYNAGVAWFSGHAGLRDQLLPLQYKAFCGGCTVVAALATPVFDAGGDHAVLWKGLALAWTAATLVAGFFALDRLSGRTAAWAWLALGAVPTPGQSDAGLMLWGNHQESALIVLVAVLAALEAPALVAGFCAGAALWFCRTTFYALPVLAALLASRGASLRDRIAGTLGLAAGGALMLIPAGAGDWGGYRMSPLANLFPNGLEAAMDRLDLLLVPSELAARLYATVPSTDVQAGLWLVAVAVAAGLAIGDRSASTRRFTFLAMALLYLLFYAASGFPVPPMRTNGPIVNLRYHAPWFFLGTALLAQGAGSALRARGARRWVGGLALAVVIGSNLGAWVRMASAWRPTPSPWSIPAVSFERFAWMATWRLSDGTLTEAASDDPATEHWLRRMEGFRVAARVQRGETTWEDGMTDLRPRGSAAIAGFAQALTDPYTAWADLAKTNASLATRDPADSLALGRGMAANLAFGVTGGAPPLPGVRPPTGDPRSPEAIDARLHDLLTLARAGLAPDAPCPACGAVGAALLDVCRSGDDGGTWGACVGDGLLRLTGGAPSGAPPRREDPAAPPLAHDLAAELAWGAGLACPRPGEDAMRCEGAADGLMERERAAGNTGEWTTAFRAGMGDPAAGMDRPFTLPRPGGSGPP